MAHQNRAKQAMVQLQVCHVPVRGRKMITIRYEWTANLLLLLLVLSCFLVVYEVNKSKNARRTGREPRRKQFSVNVM
jgi:hypothetical protein